MSVAASAIKKGETLLDTAATLNAMRPDVLVAPPVAYGSSGEHEGFSGTLSIGAAATELVLVELGRSALPATVRIAASRLAALRSGIFTRAMTAMSCA